MRRFVGMLAFLMCLGGCQTVLEGEGELSIGMQNSNFLVIKHRAIHADEAMKSRSALALDTEVWELLKDEPESEPTVD